ncbi:hypothetical protein ZOSMA_110G00260 [Zostera marina]|uniref:Uncharacterized protein n=1 Tax=Zostera marina TaxID=29655 RepID=A0A0K9Q5J5_ZOSMR|nr:hypothetical protein ZOSMA_110G00260 [Zostera marina]
MYYCQVSICEGIDLRSSSAKVLKNKESKNLD